MALRFPTSKGWTSQVQEAAGRGRVNGGSGTGPEFWFPGHFALAPVRL